MASLSDIHRTIANNVSDIRQIDTIMNSIKELARLQMIFLEPVISSPIIKESVTVQTPKVEVEKPKALDEAIKEAKSISSQDAYRPISQLFMESIQDLSEFGELEESLIATSLATMDLQDASKPISRALSAGVFKSHMKKRFIKALAVNGFEVVIPKKKTTKKKPTKKKTGKK